MNITDAIAQRHSWRTYNGLALDSDTHARLTEAIGRATDFSRTLFESITDVEGRPLTVTAPEIRLVSDDSLNGATGTYGFIKGARQFLILACGTTYADRIAGAAAFERLILDATAMGLDTCWLGGTFSRKRFDAVARIPEDMKIVAVSPVGHRTPSTRFAERMARAMVGAARRKPFDRLFTGIDTGAPDSRELTGILEAVRLAPSSGNCQPWRADVSASNRRVELYNATSNGFTCLDMGIALCHFITASDAAGIRWQTSLTTGEGRVTFIMSR